MVEAFVFESTRAECLAVYVSRTRDLRHLRRDERERVERHLSFAAALRIDARVLEGRDAAETAAAFARRQGVTQVFVSRDSGSSTRSWLKRPLVERLVNLAAGLQVTIVAGSGL